MIRGKNCIYSLQDGAWTGRVDFSPLHVAKSDFSETSCCKRSHADEFAKMIKAGNIIVPEKMTIFAVGISFLTPNAFGHRHVRQNVRNDKMCYYETVCGEDDFPRQCRDKFGQMRWSLTAYIYVRYSALSMGKRAHRVCRARSFTKIVLNMWT